MRLSRKETVAAPDPAKPASTVDLLSSSDQRPDREVLAAAIVLGVFIALGFFLTTLTQPASSSPAEQKTDAQIMADSLREYDVVANGKYSAQDVVDLCSPVRESHGKYSTLKPAPEKISITATMNGISQTAVTVVCDPNKNTRVIAAYKTP